MCATLSGKLDLIRETDTNSLPTQISVYRFLPNVLYPTSTPLEIQRRCHRTISAEHVHTELTSTGAEIPFDNILDRVTG